MTDEWENEGGPPDPKPIKGSLPGCVCGAPSGMSCNKNDCQSPVLETLT